MSDSIQQQQGTCTYCGTPVRVRVQPTAPQGEGSSQAMYCCSGCLFADSLSQSLKQDRLSLWMIGAMVTLFLIFNQVLFLLLGHKYTGQEYQAGPILSSLSLLIGAIGWGIAAGVVLKLHKLGQAPRPIGFIVVILLMLGMFVAGISQPQWGGMLAQAGLGLSFLTVFACFAQKWLLRR